MMAVSVRPAEPRDQERLRQLILQLGYEVEGDEFEARIAGVSVRADHLLVVAEGDEGEVVGMLHAFERPSIEKPPEVTIQAMVVDETYRSAGIGKALLNTAEAWAGERGLEMLGLHTQVSRFRAQAFYEGQGFAEITRSVLYRRLLDR